jgi:hypothetical protein
MGFGDFVNKAKEFADQHDEQVDQGLDRGGDLAKERFAGHDEQIDSVVDRAQQYTGAGDTTAPAEGVEPRQEVPGGPQVDVPAESGEVPPQQ